MRVRPWHRHVVIVTECHACARSFKWTSYGIELSCLKHTFDTFDLRLPNFRLCWINIWPIKWHRGTHWLHVKYVAGTHTWDSSITKEKVEVLRLRFYLFQDSHCNFGCYLRVKVQCYLECLIRPPFDLWYRSDQSEMKIENCLLNKNILLLSGSLMQELWHDFGEQCYCCL